MESLMRPDLLLFKMPSKDRIHRNALQRFNLMFGKKKANAKGEVRRYKASLVCTGFMQREGIDCVETFAPVVKFQSVRCLIAIVG